MTECWNKRLESVAKRKDEKADLLVSAQPEPAHPERTSKRPCLGLDHTPSPPGFPLRLQGIEQPEPVAIDTAIRCPQLSADNSANLPDPNSVLLTERTQNNMAIASLVHLTTSSNNRTLEGADAPVPLKSTADGWALVFEQVNYVHDVKECRTFNVRDIPKAPRPGSELEADIGSLHTQGFTHWKDDIAAHQIELLRKSYFWSPSGIYQVWSALANARLQETIQKWFKSKPSIWHCTWWGPTGSRPIYLKRNTGATDDQCLGLHILPRGTHVRYLTASHKATWPDKGFQGSGFFTNFEGEIQGYKESEPLSGGL